MSGFSQASTGSIDVYVKAATDDTSLIVPANCYIKHVIVINNTANAIAAGLKFGTSSGATDVVAALALAGSAMTFVLDAALLKRFFSKTVAQTVFVQDVVGGWNSASLDIHLICIPLA